MKKISLHKNNYVGIEFSINLHLEYIFHDSYIFLHKYSMLNPDISTYPQKVSLKIIHIYIGSSLKLYLCCLNKVKIVKLCMKWSQKVRKMKIKLTMIMI